MKSHHCEDLRFLTKKKSHDFETNYPEMEISKLNQTDLFSYLSQFDDKVNGALNRQRSLINSRYLTMMHHLEKIRKQLEQYEIKVLSLDKEIDESQRIKAIITEIAFYKKFYHILSQKLDLFKNNVAREQVMIAENSRKIADRKKVLMKVNHDNLILTERVRKLTQYLGQNHIILPRLNNSINSSFENEISFIEFSQDKILNISVRIKKCKNRFLEIKNEILNKATDFNNIKQLFEDGCELLYKNFLRSQNIISEKGLKGSLLFELKKNNPKHNEVKRVFTYIFIIRYHHNICFFFRVY